ncbi:MAG TPA: adenylate/guanylate cyclase domain-containing protein, partial [Chitinophagaceae bacterium]|nr:adenylate/guanylate cyclase domain-containing protein [Chitinophagaceae bacterium]
MADHGGKIIQYYGDGTLSIFSSAIHAVNAGIAMQLLFRKPPLIPLRIGIHIGDISVDDSGVYGDGVNIASRIESFAVAGSVFISDKVFDEIKNQPTINTISMGLFNLKNVARPVEVIAIANEGLAVPQPNDLKGKTSEPKNNLAVLPFVNMSNDADNEYFSDGIAEELINTLSKIDGLQLTCRTSSFSFKGKNQDVREIGKALNVSRVLEGSVRKSGSRVRITAELVNTADGYHLWSETFDRNLDDIFELQDEIAGIIANRMREQLVNKTAEAPEPSQNIEAYQLYLKGLFFFNKGTPADYYKAVQFFEEAITIDTSFANAHAMIASCYSALTSIGNVNPADVMEKVRAASRNAIRLNSQLPQSYLAMAMLQLYFEFQFDEAHNNISKAFLISPNSSDAHYAASHYYTIINDRERMVEEAELALRSDPLSLMKNNQLGEALLFARRIDEAEKQFLKTLELDPAWRTPMRNLSFVYMANGNYEKSYEYADRIRREVNQPGKGITSYIVALALLGKKEEARRWLEQLLGRQNEPHVTLQGDLGICHAALGDLDKAFYYLNEAYEKHVATIFFPLRYPHNEHLNKDERYWQLLDKMGLKKYYEKDRDG